MAVIRGTEIPTIDVALVTFQTYEDGAEEIAIETASSIQVEPQIEEADSIKLIVKNVLKAQKPTMSTLTGNRITLTDNVFTPELVRLVQGGTFYYWSDDLHTSKTTEKTEYGLAGYDAPLVGEKKDLPLFKVNVYSSVYDTAGLLLRYEKTSFPNCKGTPISFSSEDDTFRVSEYTIDSAARNDEPSYSIEYVDKLPL